MSKTTDSPRWCAKCQAWGEHHTDRHPVAMAEATDFVCLAMSPDGYICGQPPDHPADHVAWAIGKGGHRREITRWAKSDAHLTECQLCEEEDDETRTVTLDDGMVLRLCLDCVPSGAAPDQEEHDGGRAR